jgi:hypothetical protein
MVQQQRVAIRIGLGDAGGAERAAGAADILDNDLLLQRIGHRLGDQTRHRIGRTTGREGDDDGDDARGIIVLRLRRHGEQGQSRNESSQSF